GTLDWMFPSRPPTLLAKGSGAARPRSAATVASTLPIAPAREQETGISGGGWSTATADSILGAQLAFARAPRQSLALAGFAPGAGLSPREAGVPLSPHAPGRWSGAAWMLWRDDEGGPAYARAPRLGGSQAGVRVDYALAPASSLRPALYTRISSAVQGQAAAEIAGGIAVRPSLPLPVTLAIERREGLSPGGRHAFSLLAAGGLPPVDIGHGFRLDGYAQAGMVGLRTHDGFADGRLTVERPMAGMIAVGAGVWGGVQPGAARLDIGPQASVRLRLAGATIRLGAEWRERIAGNAAPASGPALSIGTDF
ncbi:MAG TPA: hypothetical protein VF463_15015, partial [Sphingobium sp.]